MAMMLGSRRLEVLVLTSCMNRLASKDNRNVSSPSPANWDATVYGVCFLGICKSRREFSASQQKNEFQIQKVVDSQMLKGTNVEPSKSVNEFLISKVSKGDLLIGRIPHLRRMDNSTTLTYRKT